jgi:hypothetical protein
VPAARLGPREQVDDVIEVTLLLRAGRRILAAHHANESHVVGAPAHHLERLHQPGEAIALDTHLLFDLRRRAHRALVDGGRPARFSGRAFTFGRRRLRARLRGGAFALGRFTGRLARRFRRGLGRRFIGRGFRRRLVGRCFRRGLVGRGFRRGLARLCGGVGRRLGGGRFSDLFARARFPALFGRRAAFTRGRFLGSR